MKYVYAFILAVIVLPIAIMLYTHNYEECRNFGHSKLYCLTGSK